jgi:hypothetical protein
MAPRGVDVNACSRYGSEWFRAWAVAQQVDDPSGV